MLICESDTRLLKRRINYYVSTGKLLNPRKGIYAKPGYNPGELACILYTPSYISLQYVLQRAGVIFQFGSHITCISYLNRNVEINGLSLVYRKIKSPALVNPMGIVRNDSHLNMATPERAFLDLFYLEKDYYFDNINPLSREKVYDLLPLFGSKTLEARVNKLFRND